jgi:hypothetical protein
VRSLRTMPPGACARRAARGGSSAGRELPILTGARHPDASLLR